jgi:hypothetical protein
MADIDTSAIFASIVIAGHTLKNRLIATRRMMSLGMA